MIFCFDKGRKRGLRNPTARHSNAHKMETNGSRDMKLGLKLSLKHPLCDQRCSQIFFPKLGSKWSLFLTKGRKGGSGTQQAVTQRPIKWKRMVLET